MSMQSLTWILVMAAFLLPRTSVSAAVIGWRIREKQLCNNSLFLILSITNNLVATSFKSHEICRISTSFVLLHIAFILLL